MSVARDNREETLCQKYCKMHGQQNVKHSWVDFQNALGDLEEICNMLATSWIMIFQFLRRGGFTHSAFSLVLLVDGHLECLA
jgi:hypothetical protein